MADDILLLKFQSDVLFNIDSAVLDGGARSTLDDVAGVVAEYRKTAVVIQGHTDSTGTEEHNQELSERRAQAVYNHFAGRGIDPQCMAALGFGEGSPAVSNADPGGRRLNRRVEVLLKAKAV